jgi:hypothetical protein
MITRNNTKQHTMMAKLLLISIGLLMSFTVFAVQPTTTYATQQALNTEISNRAAADTAEATARLAADNAEAISRQAADSAMQSQINTLNNAINGGILFYIIGDIGPAGGIVFYVAPGGLHGLEAAPQDQDSGAGAAWGCLGTDLTGAYATAVGTGAQNTVDILAGCNVAGIAARLADNYSSNGYTDWYLPSKDELNLLWQQKTVVGGFASGNYWSSTEINSNVAWYQVFNDGLQDGNLKNGTFRVRAVRAF